MSHLHAGLSPETTEKARLELNENPDTLHQDIQQVLGTDTRGLGISIEFPFESFTAKLPRKGSWFPLVSVLNVNKDPGSCHHSIA